MKKSLAWLREWFWEKQIGEPSPATVKDVIKNVVVFEYQGQKICLSTTEKDLFDKLPRRDKKGMAQKFRKMEEKGRICFVEYRGQLVCIKNKDYGNTGRTDKRKD